MFLPRFATFTVGLLVLALPALACGGALRSHGTATTSPGPTSPASTVPPASLGSAQIRAAVTPKAAPQRLTMKTPDGRTRSYRLYVPSTVEPSTAGGAGATRVPLLVALHGGVGSADQYARTSNFEGLAEANGFIVVFPDGTGLGRQNRLFRTWNGGNCCGPAMKHGVDDVAFVKLLVESIERTYPVDPARVFAAGHSNGGVLAYRLACELPDTIAAIGVQSTSLGVEPCTPSRPVSVLHIHGTADTNIPINGGKGSDGISGVSFRPPFDGARTLAAADGCGTTPGSSVDPANADITIERFPGCPAGIDVEFVKVAGAAHGWMGAPKVGRARSLEPYQKLDASAVIWAFLSAHPRP